MYNLRKAILTDLDYLAHIDLKVDGLTAVIEINLTPEVCFKWMVDLWKCLIYGFTPIIAVKA